MSSRFERGSPRGKRAYLDPVRRGREPVAHMSQLPTCLPPTRSPSLATHRCLNLETRRSRSQSSRLRRIPPKQPVVVGLHDVAQPSRASARTAAHAEAALFFASCAQFPDSAKPATSPAALPFLWRNLLRQVGLLVAAHVRRHAETSISRPTGTCRHGGGSRRLSPCRSRVPCDGPGQGLVVSLARRPLPRSHVLRSTLRPRDAPQCTVWSTSYHPGQHRRPRHYVEDRRHRCARGRSEWQG